MRRKSSKVVVEGKECDAKEALGLMVGGDCVYSSWVASGYWCGKGRELYRVTIA